MAISDKNYQIEIKGFRLYAYHGVFPEENKLGQEFEIDLKLRVKRSENIQDDNLEDTVSYWEVMQTAQVAFTSTIYKLIETAALAVLDSISIYPEIEWAKVRVKKLAPPVPATITSIGVTFEQDY